MKISFGNESLEQKHEHPINPGMTAEKLAQIPMHFQSDVVMMELEYRLSMLQRMRILENGTTDIARKLKGKGKYGGDQAPELARMRRTKQIIMCSTISVSKSQRR